MMVISEDEFETVLQHARCGDRDSINRLLRTIREDLQRQPAKIPRWLQPRADQSDLVQETIFSLSEKLNQFRGESLIEFLEWGRKSLKHMTANYRRGQKSLKRDATREVRDDPEAISQSPLTHRLVADQSTPSQATARAEYETLRHKAIAQLPEEQRQVMTLRDQGNGPSQIAAILGLSSGQVAGLLRRGREAIHETLSKHESDING